MLHLKVQENLSRFDLLYYCLQALEALPEVKEAAVSHEAGTAVLTLNAPVADEILKKAVEDQDYEVVSVE